MNIPPYFPFYYTKFESDENVKLMTNQQVGIYLKLLNHQWHEGSIPNNPTALGKIVGEQPDTLNTLWPGIKKCFRCYGSRLKNLHLDSLRFKIFETLNSQSEAGKKTTNKRWGSRLMPIANQQGKRKHRDRYGDLNKESNNQTPKPPDSEYKFQDLRNMASRVEYWGELQSLNDYGVSKCLEEKTGISFSHFMSLRKTLVKKTKTEWPWIAIVRVTSDYTGTDGFGKPLLNPVAYLTQLCKRLIEEELWKEEEKRSPLGGVSGLVGGLVGKTKLPEGKKIKLCHCGAKGVYQSLFKRDEWVCNQHHVEETSK